jgi:hypothetical protein
LTAEAIISSVAPALLSASITSGCRVGSVIGPPHVSPLGPGRLRLHQSDENPNEAALKHAFPNDKIDHRIMVTYDVAGTNWKLSIADNGIGKRTDVFAQSIEWGDPRFHREGYPSRQT